MNIIFENEEEKKDFDHYRVVRGDGTYKMVYDALIIITDSDKVSACDFMGLIRYDKRLRDQLYIYLATIEEYLKNECNKRLEYNGNKMIKRFDDKIRNKIIKSNTYGYNLFKYTEYTFNDLIEIIKYYKIDLKLDSKIEQEILLKSIKKLRNDVMHHGFLLLNPASLENITQINKYFNEVRESICLLNEIMPKEWKTGLLKSIKLSNYDKKADKAISKYLIIEV